MALLITIPGSGGCCPCDQQSGCNCSAVPCGLSCEGKASDAELCGFEELTDSSVPPKKYRKRTLDGTLTKKHQNEADCTDDDCPGRISFDGRGVIPGSGSTFDWTGNLVQVGPIVAGIVTYEAQDLDGVREDTPPEVIAARLQVDNGGVITTLVQGNTIALAVGTVVDVIIQLNYVVWTTVDSGCMQAGLPAPVTTVDDWDLVQQVNASTCTLTEVDHNDLNITGDNCPSGPTACYGSGVSIDTDKTERSIEGVGCEPGGYNLWSGEITETLTDEDTEEDAIARAVVPLDWIPGSCQTLTAFKTERLAGQFEFAFRAVQVRAIAGSLTQPLLAGHTYNFKTRFSHRPLGTSTPFAVFLEDEFSFTASGPNFNALTGIYTSAPFPVPTDVGFETRASGCSVEEQP